MRWMIAAMFLGLCVVSAVVADIPPRRPVAPPNPQANFVIEVDQNATEARLVVPRKIAAQKAGLDIPADGNLAIAEEAEAESPSYRTMIAGLSLALAISCAGLWLVRRGKTSGKTLMFVIAVGGLLGGSALVWANVAPPAGRPKPPAPPANQIKITVEYIAQGDTVKLIVPPAMAKALFVGDGAKPGSSESPPPSAKPE